MTTNGCCRIVLTGGPGGGKTTAADLFRRELGEQVVVVPEAATMLFAGGFPRYEESHAKRAVQATIFHLQKNLEDVQNAKFGDRILVCDRGTVDGAAYWPGPQDEFFAEMGTTLEEQFKRYDAVIYFESAAAGHDSIEGGNRYRKENLDEAVALDKKLRAIWSQHPNFNFIGHDPSFFRKITNGINVISTIADQIKTKNGV